MAIPCTGVTVTWDGVDFKEVRDFKFQGPGSEILGRTQDGWVLDRGTIQIECFGTTNVNISNYGKRKVLTIAGGGISFNVDCLYDGVQVEGPVNDVTRYRVSFKVLDTTGAGA